ncbi:DNA-binding protein [Flagellimonas lutimaris]|uniref:DNA-binding protein n=1 Tax=Flagellimonas lutimaris TaxID=475082 RepID=A0A3A1N4D1_9FLAO|nr:DNA-binding protein [Allomuricauda lutimaris]RIV31553.1 DNA-binding protein [Allomuricauda lutimaris]
MAKDLTTSNVHRKNILNNKYALQEIEQEVAFPGILFEGSLRYTKRQIAQFFDIDERTINRYLEQHEAEFAGNGYEVLSGKRLREFKEAYEQYISDLPDVKDMNVPNMPDGSDTDAANISKAPKVGVFSFRAFLNIGMLLTESDRAKQLRALILDIVIDTINSKIGGNTKYINQREEEFLPSAIREFNYRQAFTDALDDCIVENKWKYAQFTDAVYKSIFHENAKEYKKILNLKSKDSARDTMYSEVLDLIAAYENGFADILCKKKEEIGRELTMPEAQQLFKQFEQFHDAAFKPLLEKARTLMASRDMVFRDALHEKLKSYVTHLTAEEFDKFLGDKSKALEERLKDNMDVFKRLKNR